jgi:acylphosphatase
VKGGEGPVRARIRVKGSVQGVGYRYSTLLEAERLGLSGSVRNLPDGSVEAVAEGDRAAVEALVAWCRSGPGSARVRSVDVCFEAALGEGGPFQILRT